MNPSLQTELEPGAEPRPSRPHMPGYGVLGPTQGNGLLPWRWAQERLAASHDYWLTGTPTRWSFPGGAQQ